MKKRELTYRFYNADEKTIEQLLKVLIECNLDKARRALEEAAQQAKDRGKQDEDRRLLPRLDG